MTLGTKLNQLRRGKNLTQMQIAERLNISQNAYNKWESDKAKPAMENLMKIADLYETDVYELLENIPNFIFNNTKCNYSTIGNPYSNFYNTSPEFLENILKNQNNIAKLLETQNIMISKLLLKSSE